MVHIYWSGYSPFDDFDSLGFMGYTAICNTQEILIPLSATPDRSRRMDIGLVFFSVSFHLPLTFRRHVISSEKE